MNVGTKYSTTATATPPPLTTNLTRWIQQYIKNAIYYDLKNYLKNVDLS